MSWSFFGLSVPVVQLAGGSWSAPWDGACSRTRVDRQAINRNSATQAQSRVLPVTMPLTVGPAIDPVAITIGANHPDSFRSLLISGRRYLIGVALVAATVFVAYRYADG